MLRNLFNTLYRYLTSSVLNLLGLSMALAAFFVILVQVWSEYHFDREFPLAERIYRVELNDCLFLPKDILPIIGNSSPQIERYVGREKGWRDTYFTVERDGQRQGYSEQVDRVFPAFAEVFDMEMIEGSADALKEPTKVLLPQSMARRFYGEDQALGKRLVINDSVSWEVGGVYRDFPENCQVENVIFRYLKEEVVTPSWTMWNYFLYVVLKEGASAQDVVDNFNRNNDLRDKLFEEEQQLVFSPLTDIYFDKRVDLLGYEEEKHGNRNTTNVLFSIGLLVLIIAAVNYVNFSTSLAPVRMKSINIQKILGAEAFRLRVILTCEAIMLSLVSLCMAFGIIFALNESALKADLFNGIALSDHPALFALMFGITLLLGLFAGLYPAFYLTKQPPIMAIKSGFAFSSSGKRLRSLLTGFQFVVSTVLIIVAMFMSAQNHYMKSMDTGLDKENIVIVPIGGDLKNGTGTIRFRNRLLESPLISEVAFCDNNLVGSNSSQNWGFSFRGENEPVDYFAAFIVSWNFPKLLGIEMEEGEYFREEMTDRKPWRYIFNRTAARKFGLQMGKSHDPEVFLLTGICKDFNFKSLHTEIAPMGFRLSNNPDEADFFMAYCYVKVSGNPYQAVDEIRKAAAEIDPAYPISIQFYDQNFNALYQKELKMTRLIISASVLVILISLMGVFGLVIFETQQRRKEIGLRKINGATISDILLLFNRRFVVMVGISFVIALPFAVVATLSWLDNFAYRVPVYWWVFAAGLLVVLLVTLGTVTIQCWNTARENPVDSLKAE